MTKIHFLANEVLTRINYEFQKSLITDFPHRCKIVSQLRYIVNKRKNDQHQNLSILLLHYYKVFKINIDTMSYNRFFFSGQCCIKTRINQDLLVTPGFDIVV